MLKKCLHYDLKSVFTYWIFGAIAMLLMSIPGGLAIRSLVKNINDVNHFPWEIFVIMLIYFVAIAFLILNEILIYVRYYKHFFSDEGYLTFTLPVKRRTLFTSKVLNGVIWQALTIIVIVVSIIAMLFFLPASEATMPDTSTPEAYEPIISAGWIFAYVLEALVLMALSSLVGVLSMYLIIAIGANIVRKNKVIATIGIAYGASMVISTVTSIFVFLAMLYGVSAVEVFPEGPSNLGLLIFFVLALVIAVLFTLAVGLALGTLRIIERKLNLA